MTMFRAFRYSLPVIALAIFSVTVTAQTWSSTNIPYTSFTVSSTTADITLPSTPTATTAICGVTINPQTAFTAAGFTITSLTAQVGANDATNNTDPNRLAFAPAFTVQAVGPTNFEMVSEVKSTTNANAWTLVARFILNGGAGTHNFGTGSATNLSAGSVKISWCMVTAL